MWRMSLNVFLLNLLGLCCSSAPAQTPPESFLGFLKPGMHLRITHSSNSSAVTIDVYSDEEYAIVNDALTMNVNELAKKYPSVAKRRDDLLEKHIATLKNESVPDLSSDLQEEFVVLHSQQRVTPPLKFCEVQHIGNDYVLIQYAEGDRQLIAKPFIKTIRLDMKLAFYVAPKPKE